MKHSKSRIDNIYVSRHVELEAALSKAKKIKKLKNNLKLVLVSLIVLILERVFDFLFSLFTGYGKRPGIMGSNPNC